MKKTFKISPDDPDLKTFELHIASMHPEFVALKEEGKPSYEHPDFHKQSLDFNFLPGNNNDYCLHALNMFDLEAVDDYSWECHELLERPLSQLTKISGDEDPEVKVRSAMHVIMNGAYFVHPEHGITNGSKLLNELVEKCYFLWEGLLSQYAKDYFKNETTLLPESLLSDITAGCSKIADDLEALAQLGFLNFGEFAELRLNQKYALLSKAFLQLYHQKIESYVQDYVDDLMQYLYDTKGYEKRIRLNTKRYVDLILMYELALKSAEIEKKHTGIEYERKIELKSPSTYIYVQKAGGYSADDTRRNYRFLYIKAWLYSWLKTNESNQSEAALKIAEDDRFYYLDKDLRRLSKDDGISESDEECIERRKKL